MCWFKHFTFIYFLLEIQTLVLWLKIFSDKNVLIAYYFLSFFLLVPVTTSSSQCANYMIDCWLTPTEKHFSYINSTPVSSSNKTDSHDITEILLKVALNTITQLLFTGREQYYK